MNREVEEITVRSRSRRMKWAGHMTLWERGEVHTGFFVRKPNGRIPFGRPMHRWEYNIKMDCKQNGKAWTGLIELGIGTSGGLLWARCMYIRVP